MGSIPPHQKEMMSCSSYIRSTSLSQGEKEQEVDNTPSAQSENSDGVSPY